MEHKGIKLITHVLVTRATQHQRIQKGTKGQRATAAPGDMLKIDTDEHTQDGDISIKDAKTLIDIKKAELCTKKNMDDMKELQDKIKPKKESKKEGKQESKK